jgi:uncharacterized protein (DUF924 family)
LSVTPRDVPGFWVGLSQVQRFAASDALDGVIAGRFGDLDMAARRCELAGWRETG